MVEEVLVSTTGLRKVRKDFSDKVKTELCLNSRHLIDFFLFHLYYNIISTRSWSFGEPFSFRTRRIGFSGHIDWVPQRPPFFLYHCILIRNLPCTKFPWGKVFSLCQSFKKCIKLSSRDRMTSKVFCKHPERLLST